MLINLHKLSFTSRFGYTYIIATLGAYISWLVYSHSMIGRYDERNTMRLRYKSTNFVHNSHKRQPTTPPSHCRLHDMNTCICSEFNSWYIFCCNHRCYIDAVCDSTLKTDALRRNCLCLHFDVKSTGLLQTLVEHFSCWMFATRNYQLVLLWWQ